MHIKGHCVYVDVLSADLAPSLLRTFLHPCLWPYDQLHPGGACLQLIFDEHHYGGLSPVPHRTLLPSRGQHPTICPIHALPIMEKESGNNNNQLVSLVGMLVNKLVKRKNHYLLILGLQKPTQILTARF